MVKIMKDESKSEEESGAVLSRGGRGERRSERPGRRCEHTESPVKSQNKMMARLDIRAKTVFAH